MRKIYAILIFSMFLWSVSLVSAHEHNFDETKQLIESGISCDKLSDEQLETIGDYYMEHMHSGEAHEIMDQMMGGEGSESLKQMHIQMARRLYCNEDIGGVMGGGMIGYSGMMGNTYYGNRITSFNIFGWIIMFLIIFVLVLFIIWLIKQLPNPRHGRKF